MPRRIPSQSWLENVAAEEVEQTVDALPAELRVVAQEIPVTCEAVPGGDLVDEGIEPDTLGLFVGETHATLGSELLPLPPQIILYLHNIWDFANGSGRAYRAELRKTYLHELGHYLGLDEDELYERGME